MSASALLSAWHDAGTGTVESTFATDVDGSSAVTLVYEPRGPVVGAAVLCGSLFDEISVNGRREVMVARRLAERGVVCARFNYRGTGNSPRPAGSSLTLTSMVRDAQRVAEDLLARFPSPEVTFIGVRVGGIVAARLAAATAGAGLVLWEPVSGADYLRDLSRASRVAGLRTGKGDARGTGEAGVDGSSESRRDGGPIRELLAHGLDAETEASLMAASLPDGLGERRRVLVLRKSRGGVPPRSDPAGRWGAAGHDVEVHDIENSHAWWFVTDQWASQDVEAETIEVVSRVVDWMPSGSPVEPTTQGGPTSEYAVDEAPIFLQAGSEHLFGVVNQSRGAKSGVGVLCLHAASMEFSSHRNGTWARLCRRLADDGAVTLRMDFHGTGESSGLLGERGVGEQIKEDVRAGVRCLRGLGADRVVLVGNCYGALVALVMAAELDEVASICLVSPPVRGLDVPVSPNDTSAPRQRAGRSVRQLLSLPVLRLALTDRQYRRWLLAKISRRVTRRSEPAGLTVGGTADFAPDRQGLVDRLLDRGLPVLMLFGEDDGGYRRLVSGKNPTPIFDKLMAASDVRVLRAPIHALGSLHSQGLVINSTVDAVRHLGGANGGDG